MKAAEEEWNEVGFAADERDEVAAAKAMEQIRTIFNADYVDDADDADAAKGMLDE